MKTAALEQLCIVAVLGTAGLGCVVPVGPEFQDPEDNYPPYVIDSNPPVGAFVTVVGGAPATIQVKVGDANAQDRLYVRWLFDYPAATAGAAVAPPVLDAILPAGTERGVLNLAPDCAEHRLAASLNPHRLMLAVSDREFLPPEQSPSAAPYDTVAPGGEVLRAVWTVNVDCSK